MRVSRRHADADRHGRRMAVRDQYGGHLFRRDHTKVRLPTARFSARHACRNWSGTSTWHCSCCGSVRRTCAMRTYASIWPFRGAIRGHARWIELVCLLVFALPVLPGAPEYGADFAWKAWAGGEGSESATGLPWRWVPRRSWRSGCCFSCLPSTAVLARMIVYLFGPDALRDEARPPHVSS